MRRFFIVLVTSLEIFFVFKLLAEEVTKNYDDCLIEGQILCKYPLMLSTTTAKDCQILCKSFEGCIVFSYMTTTALCNLCRTVGVHVINTNYTSGPPVCTQTSNDLKEQFPMHCVAYIGITPNLLTSYIVKKGIKTFKDCHQECKAVPYKTCIFAVYDGQNCTLVNDTFQYPENGDGILFGSQQRSVIIARDCDFDKKPKSTDVLRRGMAFTPGSRTIGQYKISRAANIEECDFYVTQQRTKVLNNNTTTSNEFNAFSYWSPSLLCIATKDVVYLEKADNTAFLAVEPFGSAITKQHQHISPQQAISHCIEHGRQQCSAYILSGVYSAKACAIICQELLACKRFLYIVPTQQCLICWEVYGDFEKFNGIPETLSGTRRCLRREADNAESTRDQLLSCCPQGLPPWCATPFTFFQNPAKFAELTHRSPLECHISCNGIHSCSFATYTGGLCSLHSRTNIGAGLYAYNSTTLVIPKTCQLDPPLVPGATLVVPAENLHDYLQANSVVDCHNQALYYRSMNNVPYQSILYWPSHGLCAFSLKENTMDQFPAPYTGVYRAAIRTGFPIWIIALLVLGLIIFATLIGICFRQYWKWHEKKKRKPAENKLEHMDAQSMWVFRNGTKIKSGLFSNAKEPSSLETPISTRSRRTSYHSTRINNEGTALNTK